MHAHEDGAVTHEGPRREELEELPRTNGPACGRVDTVVEARPMFAEGMSMAPLAVYRGGLGRRHVRRRREGPGTGNGVERHALPGCNAWNVADDISIVGHDHHCPRVDDAHVREGALRLDDVIGKRDVGRRMLAVQPCRRVFVTVSNVNSGTVSRVCRGAPRWVGLEPRGHPQSKLHARLPVGAQCNSHKECTDSRQARTAAGWQARTEAGLGLPQELRPVTFAEIKR